MMYELKSGLFFSGISLFILWESLRLGLGTPEEPGSGFLSFCTGTILFVLSLIFIYRGWGVREPRQPHSRRVILAVLALFLYTLILNFLGFTIATFVFVGILFRLGESRPWWTILGMSALVTLLAYLFFGVLLNVYFPRSFLGI